MSLTWDCPSGVEVRSVRLLGPEFGRGLPDTMLEATEVCLVSPFLDLTTVQAVAKWGGKGVRRTILSTPTALNAVAAHDATVFAEHFHEVLRCGVPELLAVGCDPLVDEPSFAVETVRRVKSCRHLVFTPNFSTPLAERIADCGSGVPMPLDAHGTAGILRL